MNNKIIKYFDNNEIKVGDNIRFEHGKCIGEIEDVINSKEKLKQWGLKEYGAMIKNREFGRVFYSELTILDPNDRVVLIKRKDS